MRLVLFMFFLGSMVSAQTNQWVVPWTANRTGQWASRILLNNPTDAEITVDLTAVRPGGESETVTDMVVPATAQLILDVGQTFTTLGSGPGYSVFITSDSDTLNIAVDVSALSTASGDSPASGIANHAAEAAYRLLYPSMPWTAAGASAAVVVNPGAVDANLTIKAFSADGEVATPVTRTVPAGQPLAELTAGLFPALQQTSFLMIDSDQPILGMGFSFNGLGEPSMLNAVPVFRAETDRAALNAKTSATATLSIQMDRVLHTLLGPLAFGEFPQSGGACPAVTVGIDPEQGDQLLIKADWGQGCTDENGVFYAGNVELRISASVIFEGPNNYAGDLVFNRFETRDGDEILRMNGTGVLQGVIDQTTLSVDAQLLVNLQIPALDVDSLTEADLQMTMVSTSTGRNVTGSQHLRFENSALRALSATTTTEDPLVFDHNQCDEPIRGSVQMKLIQGTPVNATLHFGTGNCHTATLVVDNETQTINL